MCLGILICFVGDVRKRFSPTPNHIASMVTTIRASCLTIFPTILTFTQIRNST